MVASIIDGKLVAAKLKSQIKDEVLLNVKCGKTPPGLAVILVGNDPASTIYVNNKRRTCLELGFNTHAYNLPTETRKEELLSLINTLNDDPNVHGILVQLPLPTHINTLEIIEHINPNKDVDGFHPYNLGRLAQGNPHLRPCTPFGIMKLFEHYRLSVAGQHAVIVGASNIVGRPMALELLHAKATVTICHRQTKNLREHVRMADILIVATGVPNVVEIEWLQPRQILIDIGIHRQLDRTIHGDVDFNLAKNKVAWITPVPGGAGPMTICMLLHNTLLASTHLSR